MGRKAMGMGWGWWGLGIGGAIAALMVGGTAGAGELPAPGPTTPAEKSLAPEPRDGVEKAATPDPGLEPLPPPGEGAPAPASPLAAGTLASLAQTPGPGPEAVAEGGAVEEWELDPAIEEQSPVLRRWRQAIPDIAAEIQQDPAFRPRLRLGYGHFPSNDGTGGLSLAAQDILLGQTPLALGVDYHRNSRGDRLSYGGDLQYYLRPLGSYWNLAPVVGYRVLEAPGYRASGPQVGVRLVVIPSRTGAADLAVSQTWVLPSNGSSIGLTTLSVGYALTRHLRLSTDIQWQNAPSRQDSRVGILVEWML